MSLTFDDVQTSTPIRCSAFSPLRDNFSGNACEDAFAAFDEEDARLGGVDVPKVSAEGVMGQFADGPGHLDAGRAAADHDEGHVAVAVRTIRMTLGLLEG